MPDDFYPDDNLSNDMMHDADDPTFEASDTPTEDFDGSLYLDEADRASAVKPHPEIARTAQRRDTPKGLRAAQASTGPEDWQELETNMMDDWMDIEDAETQELYEDWDDEDDDLDQDFMSFEDDDDLADYASRNKRLGQPRRQQRIARRDTQRVVRGVRRARRKEDAQRDKKRARRMRAKLIFQKIRKSPIDNRMLEIFAPVAPGGVSVRLVNAMLYAVAFFAAGKFEDVTKPGDFTGAVIRGVLTTAMNARLRRIKVDPQQKQKIKARGEVAIEFAANALPNVLSGMGIPTLESDDFDFEDIEANDDFEAYDAFEGYDAFDDAPDAMAARRSARADRQAARALRRAAKHLLRVERQILAG